MTYYLLKLLNEDWEIFECEALPMERVIEKYLATANTDRGGGLVIRKSKDLLNTPFEITEREADFFAKWLGAVDKRNAYYPNPYGNERIHAHYFNSARQELMTYSHGLKVCTMQNKRQWADYLYLKLKPATIF